MKDERRQGHSTTEGRLPSRPDANPNHLSSGSFSPHDRHSSYAGHDWQRGSDRSLRQPMKLLDLEGMDSHGSSYSLAGPECREISRLLAVNGRRLTDDCAGAAQSVRPRSPASKHACDANEVAARSGRGRREETRDRGPAADPSRRFRPADFRQDRSYPPHAGAMLDKRSLGIYFGETPPARIIHRTGRVG